MSKTLAATALAGCAIAAGGSAVVATAWGQGQQVGPPLQAVNWADSGLPGAVCKASKEIVLKNHTATLSKTGFGNVDSHGDPDQVIVYGAGDVEYGTVGAAKEPAAAIDVMCSNNGGTADGQLRSARVMFGGQVGATKLLGIITPQHPSARDQHVPLLGKVTFSGGDLTVREYFYGANDPTCCASGRATTTWELSKGKLKAINTVVTKRAAS